MIMERRFKVLTPSGCVIWFTTSLTEQAFYNTLLAVYGEDVKILEIDW